MSPLTGLPYMPLPVTAVLCDCCGAYPAERDDEGHVARCEDCRGTAPA